MGLGHMYRVFALIEMCKKEFDTTVITKSTTALEIIPKEYKVDIITSEVSKEVEWLSKKYTPEHIIVLDGYQFDSSYQKKIKEKGFTLVYIDDLVSEYMYADIVVNHSLHVKATDYRAEPYTKFALGTDYAMLRPMFLEQAKKNRIITQIDTAFICFGGADFYNLTYKVVNAIIKYNVLKEINVVLGEAYSHQSIFTIEDKRLKIHKDLSEKDMIDVMKRCNLAVVPASTILYELCSVKMPIISGYYVDNQKFIYESMVDKKLVAQGGDFNGEFGKSLKQMFCEFDKDIFINNQKKYFRGESKQNFLTLFSNYG